jgi:chaperone modulatory protein CbpM
MITIELLCAQLAPLSPRDVMRWIEDELVRPDGTPGNWLFRPIDVERVRLIIELRQTMAVNDEALPVVLSLLDQLYDMRRHIRRLHAAVQATLQPGERDAFLRRLAEARDPPAGGR